MLNYKNSLMPNSMGGYLAKSGTEQSSEVVNFKINKK
jgi:hypothetical protein